MRSLSLAILLSVCASALADPRTITLRDLPDTDGNWQEGAAVIPASRKDIHLWLTDYPNWPKRFPDIEWVKIEPDDAQGRHVIHFYSRLAGCVFEIHEKVADDLIVVEGFAPHIHTQGRMYLLDLGGNKTQMLMQSTAEVHGFIGLFATKKHKRRSSFTIASSHLNAIFDLAVGAPLAAPPTQLDATIDGGVH